jgi:putative membrane protein
MKYPSILLILFVVVLLWSGIQPKETFTWMLEVFPAIIGTIILILTRKSFPFTPLVYTFIFIHACILCVGGHYTYAEVPAFDWIKEVFHQSRNNYDKVGHFAQGFVPALIIRELFIRKEVVAKNGWLGLIVVSICMAISAAYELLEWLVSVFSGEAGDAFLGTQGYVWDTQSDMLYAMIGAITAWILLSSIQNKQIQKFKNEI